jgi:hypothetical protein
MSEGGLTFDQHLGYWTDFPPTFEFLLFSFLTGGGPWRFYSLRWLRRLGAEVQLMPETAKLALCRLSDTSFQAECADKKWLEFGYRLAVITHAITHPVSNFVAKSIVLDDVNDIFCDIFPGVAFLDGREGR